MVMEGSGNSHNGKQPVHLDKWLRANLPHLHPTRRKVLTGVAELTQGGDWTTSSEVRRRVGISQQLLNRHLRALESQGLVRLEHPGPGLPLNAQVTSFGLRALGLRGPRPVETSSTATDTTAAPASASAPVAAPAAPAPPVAPPGAGQGPVVRLSPRTYQFLERLYRVLAPFAQNLDRRSYYTLAAPALRQRPAAAALYEALSPYLPGLGAVEFKEMLASLAGGSPGRRQKERPSPARPQPPALSQAERALEEQLERTKNPAYRGLAWHQRTKLMGDEWDRARRRRLGRFNTSFDSFAPRWERPDWADFNHARRQADHRGADYAEWVAVQFDRLAPYGEREVLPADLHGEEAVAAYLDQHHQEGGGVRELGPPPYRPDTFNLQDPDHLAYAQRLIEETTALAEHIMSGDPQGSARLLAEAVRSGSLPMAALDLVPDQRQAVLDILQREKSSSSAAQPAAGPLPKIII